MTERGWLQRTPDRVIRLSPDGLEQSDAIGPLLYSPAVRDLMARCDME